MPCLICGDPKTVKSHIVPRALFHAMKRPGHTLVMTRRGDSGYVESQSGAFDSRILCDRHEAHLGPLDSYAAKICKAVKSQRDKGAMKVAVENPDPAKLVGFAAAVVWRMAASRTDLSPERMLGPYAKKLEDQLFRTAPFDPLLLISLNAYRLHGSEIMNFGALPHIYLELDRRFWRFIVCGMIFDLKLDNRTAPAAMETLAVNHRKEFVLFDDFPAQIMNERGYASTLTSMASRRRPHPQSMQKR